MDSSERTSLNPGSKPLGLLPFLFSRWMIISVWVPVAAISAFHYGTSHEYHWVHDIMRRAYYLPIVVAAMRLGLLSALITAVVITLVYLPHAFFAEHHFDPARSLEKILEICLYFIVAAVAGYLADLERKRRAQLQHALDEQQRLTKQLVRAGRLSAIGEVVAGIAHEIKNPLHAMTGTAEIIDPLIPQDKEEHRMWVIHKEEIGRLRRVAERFVSFAKPTPIETVRIDLRDVARRLVELVGAQARQSGIAVTTAVPDHPVWVQGDLDQLAQIALNIAVNGIKAIGDQGGRIEVSVDTTRREASNWARLRLANDGPPIDENEIERLFDPFHSSHDSTGLGLSISARIAEQHRGYIETENNKSGVTFTVFLPQDD